MSRGFKFFLFALGFLVATGLEAARADEAFLCEGGRIVYVPLGQLEEKKRTDSCVASHFGLAVVPATVTSPQPAATTPPPPLVQEEQARAAQSASGKEPARPVWLRPLNDPEISTRARTVARRVTGPRPLPRAAEGTDFRNIPVINASAEDPKVYLHQR